MAREGLNQRPFFLFGVVVFEEEGKIMTVQAVIICATIVTERRGTSLRKHCAHLSQRQVVLDIVDVVAEVITLQCEN